MSSDRGGNCVRDTPARARGLRLILCAFIALLLPIIAGLPAAKGGEKRKDAPKPYALIFGTVWTPGNREAPGVRVKIRQADEKKARWELVSNSQGEFAQRVPVGPADYVVWAETKGHKTPAAETKVHVVNDERQDIGLHLTE
jgi:hypothetical protein